MAEKCGFYWQSPGILNGGGVARGCGQSREGTPLSNSERLLREAVRGCFQLFYSTKRWSNCDSMASILYNTLFIESQSCLDKANGDRKNYYFFGGYKK